MSVQNDVFYLKELALSAFRGNAVGKDYTYKTVFHNTTINMENTKMFEGVFVGEQFYEFKLTRRRDPIKDKRAPFVGVRDKVKTRLMDDYFNFVKTYYPILHINSTVNRIFISHFGYDYEITFVAKQGVLKDE